MTRVTETTRPLVVAASPHLKGRDSVPTIMWNVVGSLVPVIVVAAWLFGPSALLVIMGATVGALATERAFGPGGRSEERRVGKECRSRWSPYH